MSGAIAGDESLMAETVARQPEWLAGVAERVGDRRFDTADALFMGSGTSYHAAQAAADLTGGRAVEALELILRRPAADLLVVFSHEGATAMTVEAVRSFAGRTWLITGAADSPLAHMAEEVILASPELERSWCHTASYTTALAAVAHMAGYDIDPFSGAVAEALGHGPAPSEHDRLLVVGAGRDWPTAQEAALKLREGTYVDANAYQTEQLLHGHLAAIDERFRAFVLEGEGRARSRSADVVRALQELGVEVELLPQDPRPERRALLGIIPFQVLTVALAAQRGVNPDRARQDVERWRRARRTYV